MDLSIVISLLNEEESLPELITWIKKVMVSNNFTYELILIDDGSKDKSWQLIENYAKEDQNIRGIKFRRNYGKSAALYTGFQMTRGEVVITMDADLQDSPEEIPGLYAMIKNEGYDLVSGWKKKRHDPKISKNLPSKIYNATARWAFGIKLHDLNCGLKAYKNEVVKSVEVYGDMHRYIPILAKQAGYSKIGEKVVEHQKRKYGTSKFGIERFWKGLLDLLTISFTSKFGKRPMHFFGLLGLVFFVLGTITLLYLSFMKFAFLQYKMTDRPLFFFGLLSIIFGGQMFFTGFIAELVARNATERNVYQIEKTI